MTEKKKSTAIAKQGDSSDNLIAQFHAKTMEIWKDEKAIREMFCKDLSEIEFKYFISLGVMFGANPFAGEIWPVKYDKNKPASIFLGRNFKRRKAQELEDYDGHYAAAVYSKDKFKVLNGVPDHEYATGDDRGKLLGAYCVVHKKSISRPHFVYVKFNEYNTGKSTWNGKPETMITKVAENQGLTAAFQGTYQNTYDESEQWKEPNPENVVVDPKMEVSAEVVRGHDKTGFQEKPIDGAGEAEADAKALEEKEQNPDAVLIEDAILEAGKQKSTEGLKLVWEKHSSLQKNEDFIDAVVQIRSNIESEERAAKEAHEATEQKVINDEDGRNSDMFDNKK